MHLFKRILLHSHDDNLQTNMSHHAMLRISTFLFVKFGREKITYAKVVLKRSLQTEGRMTRIHKSTRHRTTNNHLANMKMANRIERIPI